jgi:HlyD family secretion protein
MNDMTTLRDGSGLPVLAGTRATASRALDDASAEKRWGWLIVFLFFGVFMGWALFARLDAAAYATGTIAVAGNRQTVQHRDGGTIAAIHVREGQHVRAGEILIELAGAETAAAERSLFSQVVMLQAQRARLLAQQAGTAIARPPEFAALTGADRQEAEAVLAQQAAELEARRRALRDQKGVLNQQAAQLSQQIQGFRDQMNANVRQNELLEDELKGLRQLAEKGFASINRVRALERSQVEVSSQSAGLNASAAAAREQIGQTRMQALGLDSQSLQQVSEELRTVEGALNEALPKYQAAREQLDHVRIRAPASGQVVGLEVFTVGGVIAPGQKLMEIVPDAAPLVIQAQVQPNDADDLYVGQQTEIRIPALHERNMPVFNGSITRLSADSFRDERTGAQYYTATVTVPQSEIEEVRRRRGGVAGLKAGLPVEVLVPLRKRTMFQYLVEPLNQALWRSFREH